MPTATVSHALTLDLALRPYELMAAWRPESRNLVLVVSEPVQVRQAVQARISVLGHDLGATILGRAASAVPHPMGVELELEPDPLRARTLERLVEAVASGGRAGFRARPPRWLAEIPAFVYRLGQSRRTVTFSVSERGCGLRWFGDMPPVGTALQLHVGAGDRVASFCGDVRWTAPLGRAPALGMELAAGDDATWAAILADVRRGGAPPA